MKEVGTMIELDNIVLLVVSCAVGFGLARLLRWAQKRSRRVGDETFSDPGVSVEVDCRSCGQFNRVPSHRLRDRPKCGRCKARLMPGKRVVLCRVSPMEGLLRAELDALWKDEDRLWQCLANHVAIEAKAKAEARDPQLRVVN
jgi:hypothetical protein